MPSFDAGRLSLTDTLKGARKQSRLERRKNRRDAMPQPAEPDDDTETATDPGSRMKYLRAYVDAAGSGNDENTRKAHKRWGRSLNPNGPDITLL